MQFAVNGYCLKERDNYIQLRTSIVILFSYVIIFLFSMSGCTTSTKTAPDSNVISIVIDEQNHKKTYPMSMIAEKVDKIQLETNELSFIDGDIQGIHLMDDYIVIEDASTKANKGVLVFDLEGKFIRRIGRRGQGPGELYGLEINRQAVNNKGFIFWFHNGHVLFDIEGKTIEDKRRALEEEYWSKKINYSYYFNEKLYFIRDIFEQRNGDGIMNTFLKIYDYSTGNFLDSLLINEFNSSNKGGPRESKGKFFTLAVFNTIFQFKGQLFFFYNATEDNNRYLFSIENNKFEKIANFCTGNKTSIRGLTISDRFIVIMHRKLNMPSSTQISTPESRAFLRNAPAPPPPDHYYTVNDLQTGKSITSYQGFVDDILYSGDIIKIRFFIDGGGKFYYVKEGEWSDEHKAELNPTLFIGTFK